MRAEHLTKWLKTYHDQFSYELNVFGYDAGSFYPFAKFQQDVHDLFPIGLTWAFIVATVNLIILNNLYICIFDVIESPGKQKIDKKRTGNAQILAFHNVIYLKNEHFA